MHASSLFKEKLQNQAIKLLIRIIG